MFFVFNLSWYTKDPIKGNPAEKAAEAWMVCGMSFQKKDATEMPFKGRL